MNMEEFCLIVLNCSSDSIHLFKLLKDERIDVDIMSTPCTISAGCSRSIRIQEKEMETAKQVIKTSKIIIKGIFKKVYRGSGFYYLKLF